MKYYEIIARMSVADFYDKFVYDGKDSTFAGFLRSAMNCKRCPIGCDDEYKNSCACLVKMQKWLETDAGSEIAILSLEEYEALINENKQLKELNTKLIIERR